MVYEIKLTRAVARRLVDLLDPPDGEHKLVCDAFEQLIQGLDEAQGKTPGIVEIHVTGTNMDLPE